MMTRAVLFPHTVVAVHVAKHVFLCPAKARVAVHVDGSKKLDWIRTKPGCLEAFRGEA